MKKVFQTVALLLTVGLASVVFYSCSDEEKDKKAIQVKNQEDLTQTLYADEQEGNSISITTTSAWTSMIQIPAAPASLLQQQNTIGTASNWISISPDHGDSAGDYNIVISLEVNTTGSDRTAEIIITCGNEKITISVTQSGVKDTNQTAKLLPEEIEVKTNYNDYYCLGKFYYDEQNRIVKMEEIYENGSRIEVTTYTYNEEGQFIRMESTENDFSINYTYSENKVTAILKENDGEAETIQKRILLLNEKGLITEKLAYHQNSSQYDTYKYEYDTNGNITKNEWIDNKSCNSVFTYDNKKNVYSSINIPAWFWIHTSSMSPTGNNLLSRKGCGEEITFSYEYNEYDYPTKRTMKNEEGLYIETIKYINAK